MADRNQVLIDFQECSNIENLEECMAILEQHDWSLLDALNSVTHLDTQTLPSENVADQFVNVSDNGTDLVPPLRVDGHSVQTDPWSIGNTVTTSFGGFAAGISDVPSLATPSMRMLHFTVEYRDRNIPVVLKDSETVGKIKSVLESEVNIPSGMQELKGWENRRVFDHSVLRDLNLPKEFKLYLLTPNVSNPTMSVNSNNTSLSITDMTDRLSLNFTLQIKYKETGMDYTLNFPGTKSVLEVKQAVYNITNVPVSKQVWKGWPPEAGDNTMTLAGCGITHPCHSLELTTSKESTSRRAAPDVVEQVELSSDSDDDEFEDAQDDGGFDDDMLVDTPVVKQEPLMPDNVQDELVLAEHFSRVFGERYGFIHPVFYLGSLDDALKEALHVKAKDRRLLAVYLHYDQSIQANVFCSQVLCSETIVNYLSNNFVTWAWDLSSESNKARLLAKCTQHFGSVAATTLRNFQPDQLPLLLVITRTRSTNEVFTVIQGGITIDEVMSSLMHSVDVFQQQQSVDIQEEAEREARETMKLQQDMAYQESLAVDRAKAEAKRLEEEKQRQVELDQQILAEIAANEKRQEEQEKKAIQQSLAEALPEEPPSTCSLPVSQIRLRCPKAQIISRRFLASTRLQVLLDFIVSKGFHLEDHKVLTTYPRRDVTTLDANKTLEELKLCPQETLILEEK